MFIFNNYMMRNLLTRVAGTLAVFAIILSPFSVTSTLVNAIDGNEYVTLSDFSGKPGKTIQVSGGGYSANSTLVVYTSPTYTTLTSTNAYGEFSTNFTIPLNAPEGGLTIYSAINNSGSLSEIATNSYYVVPFTPSISTESTSNLPYSTLTVSGSGFAASESVQISLAGTSTTAVADLNGSFEGATLTVPAATPGLYNVNAMGISSGSTAVGYFYISGFFASAYPSTYYILPDETLTFGGNGFAANETINVYEGLNPIPLASFTAGADGSFMNARGVLIPVSYSNSTKTFRLAGVTSGGEATMSVTIGQFFSSVSPTAYYLTPGQKLSFNGQGFAKNETVTVYAGTTALTTLTTDESGSFEAAGEVEISFEWAGQTATFRLIGDRSNSPAETSVTVGQFYPNASPSSYYVMPGATINFTGSGFLPGETVDVFEGLKTTPTTSFVVDENGNFEAAGEITVPYNAAGQTKVFNLLGRTSKGQVSVSFTTGQLYPQISPSTYYLKPGQIFSVTGTGFADGETVTLRIGGGNAITGVRDINNNVVFENLELPFTDEEVIELVATGELSAAQAIVQITAAKYYPYVGASEYYVMPGTSLSFSGAGFAPNEEVEVSDGTNVVTTLMTDASGEITENSIVVPFGQGSMTYTLTGSKSKAGNVVVITLASFYPYAEASNYYAVPGSKIMVKGGGFAPNEAVVITAGTFTANTTADEDGMVADVAITLPFGHLTSSLEINLVGQLSNATGMTSITLAPFSAQVSPSTYYGLPGSAVSFTGTGFAANENVSVKLNNSALTTVTADEDGAFELGGLTLPFATSANYSFVGSVSGASASVSIGLASFSSSIELSTYYAPGGTAVTISGSGFVAGETVNITFGGVLLPSTTATSTGAYSLLTNVPFAAAGEKTVTATGLTSGAVAETTFTQAQVYSAVELSNYAGAPGTTIGFIGSGYLTNEPIEILTDRSGSTPIYTFNAGADGSFNNNGFVIPADFAEGNLTITIRGAHSLNTNEIVFYVTQ